MEKIQIKVNLILGAKDMKILKRLFGITGLLVLAPFAVVIMVVQYILTGDVDDILEKYVDWINC